MLATIKVKTKHQTEMINITTQVQREITRLGLESGMAVVYTPHTTAALAINEGADPSVKADILETIDELVPWERVYGHAEGNSPAHIKSTLVGCSKTFIVEEGRLLLGQWQALFFCEFDGPRERQVHVRVVSG